MPEDKELQSLAERALRFLGEKNASLDVFVVDDKTMKALNRRFLGKNSSTNVLSFESPKNFPAVRRVRHLGEIYLNPFYIKNHKEDMTFMLVHGLLHLLGYNHEGKSDRIRMERVEKKLLSWLKAQS